MGSKYFLGLLAVLSWASVGSIMLKLSNIPEFFLAFIIMSGSGIILFLYELVNNKKTVWKHWGFLGILLNQLGFIFSVRLVSVPIVDFIYALWPILLMTRIKGYKFLYSLPGSLALIGLVLLLLDSYQFTISIQSGLGILIAFLGVLAWTNYIYLSYSDSVEHTFGLYFLASALVAIVLSVFFSEIHLIPDRDFIFILWLMIMPGGFAYVFWQKALQKNNATKISCFGFFIPIFSNFMLVFSGAIAFDLQAIIGMLLLICSCLIVGT